MGLIPERVPIDGDECRFQENFLRGAVFTGKMVPEFFRKIRKDERAEKIMSEENNLLLEVDNLHTSFFTDAGEVKAVNGVTFNLEKGKTLGIVGESGSGKSTLLNMVGALDTPTSGSVRISGKDIHAMRDKTQTVFRRRNIGFIFQAFNLIPELTVEQNIMFPVLLDYRKPDMNYLNELLSVLGLESRRNHLPGQLSGGQQQRAAIGRALMTKPSLILADEPTGNLDSKNSRDVIRLLKETGAKYEQTILMITHSRNVAESADRILRVSDGIITDLGRHEEV